VSGSPLKLFPVEAPPPAPDAAELRRAAALEAFRTVDDNDAVAWRAVLDELEASYTAEMRRRDREREATELIDRLDRENPPTPIVVTHKAPAEAWPAELRPFADRDSGELPAAITAYLTGRADGPETAYKAADDVLEQLGAAQRAAPLRGYTRGELVAASLPAFSHERRELARRSPGGLGVDTELRDALSEINHLDGWQRKAALLRKVQRIHGMQGHRTAVCLRYMTKQGPTEDGQRVVYVMGRTAEPQPQLPLPGEVVAPEYARVRYRGVAVCGDGWCCPVCATKITEGRRKELRAGIQAHRDAGGCVLLLTFTFSHGPADELAGQWGRLGKALERWARAGVVKRFRAAYGFTGRVRSREITYGINGWHPHAHALELYDGAKLTPAELEGWLDELKATWRRCCTMAGLSCSLEHGFDASLTEADDYIAKWGIDAELAKWHVKTHRPNPDAPDELGLNGYTPFDLLRIHAGLMTPDPRLRLDANRAAVLFSDYAGAVKGTAQLHWTRGLKALLGIDELDDAELADRGEPDEQVLGSLTPAEWFAVVSGNHQVELLGLIASKGWAAAHVFVRHWRDLLDRASRANLARVRANRRLAQFFRGG
jgi:hypothetical protein